MSNPSDEQQTDDTDEGITDDKLPEDLRPTEDNPLAKSMDEDEELVDEGGDSS